MKCPLLFLISAFLLMQFSYALPARFTREINGGHITQNVHSDPSAKTPTVHRQMLAATLSKMSIVPKYAIKRGMKLFQVTLPELNSLPEGTKSALQPTIKKMMEYVESAENLDVSDESADVMPFFRSMFEFGSILQNVEEHPTTTSAIALKNAFYNNGFKEYQNGFDSHLQIFCTDFSKILEEYLPRLSAKDLQRLPDMKQWMKDFDAESNPTKKYEIVQQLLIRL